MPLPMKMRMRSEIYRGCGEGEVDSDDEEGRAPGGRRFRSARAVGRRAVPTVEVPGQRIDDVDHALPVKQTSSSSGPRNRRPASNVSRQNFWRRPRLTIACDRESDEWLFALSDTDAVAATGRPSASSVVPDACWYAPSRYTLVRFDRS